jgi:hypothetical protein
VLAETFGSLAVDEGGHFARVVDEKGVYLAYEFTALLFELLLSVSFNLFHFAADVLSVNTHTLISSLVLPSSTAS